MPYPLLMLHGLGDTGAVFDRLSRFLKTEGYETHQPDLQPADAREGLEPLAQQVADYCERELAGRRFHLLGFSMGGIVGRYYLQRLGGHQSVQKFITLASPHQGSWTAYALPHQGCAQMRPNSEFLSDLNTDSEQLQRHDFTSIYTPLDLMILPAQSSVLPVGKAIAIPVLLHPWMLVDRRVWQAVLDALNGDL